MSGKHRVPKSWNPRDDDRNHFKQVVESHLDELDCVHDFNNVCVSAAVSISGARPNTSPYKYKDPMEIKELIGLRNAEINKHARAKMSLEVFELRKANIETHRQKLCSSIASNCWQARPELDRLQKSRSLSCIPNALRTPDDACWNAFDESLGLVTQAEYTQYYKATEMHPSHKRPEII